MDEHPGIVGTSVVGGCPHQVVLGNILVDLARHVYWEGDYPEDGTDGDEESNALLKPTRTKHLTGYRINIPDIVSYRRYCAASGPARSLIWSSEKRM